MQARNSANAKGVDVSHYQGNIDWAKVKAAGYSFAICKGTEGLHMTDDFLAHNITGCKDAGVAMGVYHFSRACNVAEAVAEARFFCDTLDSVGGILAIDIAPVLDIETTEAKSRQTITAVCHAWLDYVEKRTGIAPMIYADRSFITDYLDRSLSTYKIWLAAYGTDQPIDQNGWTEWEFLQVSDSGNVPGIVGAVDINEFRGTEGELVFKMKTETGNAFISWCQHMYSLATCDADKMMWHERANEARIASGQQPVAPL